MKYVVLCLAACGSSAAPPKNDPPKSEPTPVAKPWDPKSWPTPAGWKAETIPFPLDFAPSLIHKGIEELRFAPGMFDPAAPGYWSYTFVWRLDDAAQLDAKQLGDELTAYFRGLIKAVDKSLSVESVMVSATGSGRRHELKARVIDAFKSKQPVDLVGWAERLACTKGSLWTFVFAPAGSPLQHDLDELAAKASC